MSSVNKKLNLRDRLDDCTLDLSMSDLEEVPVKEIALIKKGTHLDLSNNRITDLGRHFASLTYLTQLDLSKNHLTELPSNFGELTLLKHLDLYGNKLSHLPLSFSQLKALRWLDLKDNPLVPVLAEVAGLCIDQKQCQLCARKVVVFLQDMQAQVEETKQLLEEKRREELAMSKKKEDLQKEELKKKKKTSKVKENKKKENGVKQPPNAAGDNKAKVTQKVSKTAQKKQNKKQSGSSFCGKLFRWSFLLTIVCSVLCSILWVVDKEKFVLVQDGASQLWVKFVAVLPPQVVDTSSRAVKAAQPTIDMAWYQLSYGGKQLSHKVQDGYSWLSANEQTQFLIGQLGVLWNVTCVKTVELYRTLGTHVPTYIEAIKKKVF